MSGTARKAKFSKYEVTIRREVEHVAVVEVEASNAEDDMGVDSTAVLVGWWQRGQRSVRIFQATL